MTPDGPGDVGRHGSGPPSLRPPSSWSEERRARDRLDPWAIPRWLREPERLAEGGVEDTLTVFLIGAECPFRCVYCDLWRGTIDGPTPRGALPHQLAAALAEQDAPAHRVKLYNASNLFETRAVPVEDDASLAQALAEVPSVTVECHPRLVGDRCWRFADSLDGRLEVAMGLETIHPEALPRLGKEMTLDDFERAAAAIRSRDLDLRAFVLLGPPHVPPEEHVLWAVRSALWALARGARHVTLIPTRPGVAALDELAAQRLFTPPSLLSLERAASELAAAGPGVVTVDLWDLDRFVACADCADHRRSRLAGFNRTGRLAEALPCSTCGWSRA